MNCARLLTTRSCWRHAVAACITTLPTTCVQLRLRIVRARLGHVQLLPIVGGRVLGHEANARRPAPEATRHPGGAFTKHVGATRVSNASAGYHHPHRPPPLLLSATTTLMLGHGRQFRVCRHDCYLPQPHLFLVATTTIRACPFGPAIGILKSASPLSFL